LTFVILAFAVGCGRKDATPADPAPFKKAIAEYLERNNMAMALKEIKEGPTVQDKTATLTASLTHAALGGPAVTWQIRFEKNADGSWKAIGHK
jgi:ABC-type transporter MlaC component